MNTYGPTHTIDTAPEGTLWTSLYKPGEPWISVTVTEEVLRTEIRHFGVRDAKGREIGGRVQLIEKTLVPTTDRSNNRITKKAGRWLWVRPHALRDGIAYGAYQHGKRYASMEAAEAAIEKYFRDAERRAQKKG
jgi:hypothetical protein